MAGDVKEWTELGNVGQVTSFGLDADGELAHRDERWIAGSPRAGSVRTVLGFDTDDDMSNVSGRGREP